VIRLHLLLATTLVLSSSCTTTRLLVRDRELALEPAVSGPLAQLEARVSATVGPERSGFKLLEVNEDALHWRLALIDSAQGSLDVMTFLWWGDEVGDLVLQRVLAAADRGVKVRLIVDDMTTFDDGKGWRVRDVSNAAIDAHPNIKLRVFNPWSNRGLAGRAVEFVTDFSRLNQRMHNKAIIADNRAVIVGGRNLGNEYMGLSSEFNFRDVDVLGVGPAARQVSGVFDRYWNSEWVLPQKSLEGSGTLETLAAERKTLAAQVAAVAPTTLQRFPVEPEDWTARLEALAAELHAGTSRAVTDSPDQGTLNHTMTETVRRLWSSADREVLVANPYIIPDELNFKRTADELKPNVRFVMLTNSLGSTDAAGVHVHYAEWRPRLVAGGVELYEVKHDATVRSLVADTAPVISGFLGLHAKVIVIDRKKVLIGSMNLDPRSRATNTEMGLVIDCEPLAEQLGAALDRDLKPENAWRIALDGSGGVTWVSGKEVRHEAPLRDASQHLEETMHRLLPADLY
jgi:putative cardiolipin synthase